MDSTAVTQPSRPFTNSRDLTAAVFDDVQSTACLRRKNDADAIGILVS